MVVNPEQQTISEIEFDFSAFLSGVLRHWRAILWTVIGVTLLAGLFAAIQPTKYRAEAILQFDMRGQQWVDIDSVLMRMASDEAAIKSELDILQSPYMMQRVLDAMAESKDGALGTENVAARRERATAMLKNLRVYRTPRSYTLRIQYQSGTAEKAAQITNAIVNEYMNHQIGTRFSTTERVNKWLEDRVRELQKKARESERAVQEFRAKNNLIEVAGLTVNDKQLAELNSQLSAARAASAQTSAQLQQAQELVEREDSLLGADSVPTVLQSSLIQQLRLKESEIQREKSELSGRYGPKHPKMISIISDLEEISRKIAEEVEKIAKSLEYDEEIARLKVETLEGQIDTITSRVETSSRAALELAELVRQQEADVTVYESFLQRLKEVTQSQDQQQHDATVISFATPPLHPYWPSYPLFLLLGAVLGGVLGVIYAIFKEFILDNGFHNTGQIERRLGQENITILPELEHAKELPEYIIHEPTSALAESLRQVMTSVHFSRPDNPPKVLMVASSVPKEGKTVFSVALARQLAMAGTKVLLIDCDMRLPSVDRFFPNKAKYGLSHYLAGEVSAQEIILMDEQTGLHYIRSFPDTPHSQELLASRRMQEFIRKMSVHYDIILMDAPPVLALSDSLMLSKVVDAAIYMVRWENTPRSTVAAAWKILRQSNIKTASIVLSRVDLSDYRRHDGKYTGGYYSDYQDYYVSG